MRVLSKSKLMAFRQCPKRLWLEIHRPELRQDSPGAQASFDVGNQVGEIARQLYDATGEGLLIDAQAEGFAAAFSRTSALLETRQPIFEAGFSAAGAMAFADVLLPATDEGKPGWRMIEVKSSTSVKDYHRDDIAVQAFTARSAGAPLISIALAHIDSSWVYQGDGNYAGLLTEEDLTDEAFGRASEVSSWIATAQSVAAQEVEPEVRTGGHCQTPFECGFSTHCRSQEPQAEYPVHWLPSIQAKALKSFIETGAVIEMAAVPDELLNERQHRVKWHTLSGSVFFDAEGAAADLAAHELPGYFLDFETINFAVPIWKGCRPYQQIPFQFSVHRLDKDNTLKHDAFLELDGEDPSRAFAETLIRLCGEEGPVFVYNAAFEMARIRELAERFPDLRSGLLAINTRVVDLLKVARERYYHPSQQGGWSIKKVLPAVAPDLRYDQLDGVQDGGMAMNAYREAINPATTDTRREEIRTQLLNYCGLDTYAMVRLWQFFSGRNDLNL